MQYRDESQSRWPIVVGAGVLLLVLMGVVGRCSPEPTVNEELVRTIRVAVESADDARRNNDAAHLWPARFRLLVIVIGVAVPIVAAVVLVYLVTRRRPGDLEVEIALQQYRNRLDGSGAASLPQPEDSRQLESDTVEAALPAETSQASPTETADTVSAE